VEGELAVEFDRQPTAHLGPGDCVVHSGDIAHRWVVVGSAPVRIFLTIWRPTKEP
jgi:quercetin dioxygenase-like cupin family protein